MLQVKRLRLVAVGSDFSLVGISSPAAGTGISLVEVLQDFTGAARTTPADIGAFNHH